MKLLASKLAEIIGDKKGERDVTQFLAENPQILRWAVCRTGGHCTCVVKEFPFGSSFRADFVVVTSYSNNWEVHLIELEPINDRAITKAGVPSQRLNKAISQIHDWRHHILHYPVEFRRDLSTWCVKRDLLGMYENYGRPCNDTGDYLDHPATHIKLFFHIFISHRGLIDGERRKKMNQYSSSMIELSIHTYSRLLDIASNHDKSKLTGSACLTDTIEDQRK